MELARARPPSRGSTSLASGWHSRRESANAESRSPLALGQLECQTAPGPRRRCADRMRPHGPRRRSGGCSAPARAGACCQSLPPYDEARRWRLPVTAAAPPGFDADLVAAALTQSRLRAPGRRQVRRLRRAACSSPPTGSSRPPACAVAAQHAAAASAAAGRAPRARPRLRHRRRRDGARRARPAGQRRRRRRGDGRGRRGQPAALAGRDHGGRARGGPAPAHRARAPGTPARGSTRPAVPPGWPTPAGGPGGSSASTRSRRRGPRCRASPRELPATGAKLSPSFPHAAVPPGAEAQWTSCAGEVLECAVWWGPLAQRTGRSAMVAAPRRRHRHGHARPTPPAPPPTAGEPGAGGGPGSTSRTGR